MLSRPAQTPFSPFLDSRNELEVRPEHGGYQKTLTFSFFYFSWELEISVRPKERTCMGVKIQRMAPTEFWATKQEQSRLLFSFL